MNFFIYALQIAEPKKNRLSKISRKKIAKKTQRAQSLCGSLRKSLWALRENFSSHLVTR
jgi:hypothetical protein